MNNFVKLFVLGIVSSLSVNTALADPEVYFAQVSDANNFKRVKITAKIFDDVYAVYGCLKSTGKQAEGFEKIFVCCLDR